MSAPQLLVITGIMAAGKSSVAEALAARFERGVHLRGDVFRRSIVGYEGFSPSDLDGVLRTETPPIGLWLDSSELSVSETVTAILDRRAESLWP